MQKLKVTHIVGARPNFVKAAPVFKALDALKVDQSIIHTGQHYDEIMSDAFFRDLNLPSPEINLHVGGGNQFDQMSKMFAGLPEAITSTRPNALILYGDVNSSMVAAIVASRLSIPCIHVEAGLRSFDLTMPEESNRKIVDLLSSMHLTTSPEAKINLENEGINTEHCWEVGNTMIDSLISSRALFDPDLIGATLNIDGPYAVATIHRASNVDIQENADAIVTALNKVSEKIQVILPLHPRGRQVLTDAGLGKTGNVTICAPLGYTSFVSLVIGSTLVITDSGGVQEETTVLGVPCLTLRPNTERPITITEGTNVLVSTRSLQDEVQKVLDGKRRRLGPPKLWDGFAGGRAAEKIYQFLSTTKDGGDGGI